MSCELKLWEAKVGGAKYWCAAIHPEHARELLYIVGEEQGSDPEDFEDATFSELSAKRAEEIQFALDGHSLWEEFRLGSEPRVLGCSEWP